MVDDSSSWRDSARQARFFFVDAIGAVPLLFVFLHIRLWTFLTALGIMVFLAIIEKFNFTIPVFFRFLRSFLADRVKHANPWWRR